MKPTGGPARPVAAPTVGLATLLAAWHDVECGGYDADLDLWLELAEAENGPILDVGAGTGRVAAHLAAAGHEVTALDVEPELLAVLRERAPAVTVVEADARAFDLRGFALVIVPMQTLQLLDERTAFFACARRALRPGGLLAAAIADELVPFDGDLLPEPDVGECDGRRLVSQPTAVRIDRTHARIERLRTVDGVTEPDVIELAVVSAASLAAEGRAAGLHTVPGVRIPPTGEHVATSVVMFRC